MVYIPYFFLSNYLSVSKDFLVDIFQLLLRFLPVSHLKILSMSLHREIIGDNVAMLVKDMVRQQHNFSLTVFIASHFLQTFAMH